MTFMMEEHKMSNPDICYRLHAFTQFLHFSLCLFFRLKKQISYLHAVYMTNNFLQLIISCEYSRHYDEHAELI
jgi:hypothetical protein